MKYNSKNINLAKNMRSNMTKEEVKLWNILRGKRFQGLKFKRQVLIGKYIADFVCVDKMLIIEIDGGQHNQENNIEYDKIRTDFLNSEGYKVIRFWNNEVWNNIDGVCKIIEENI